jgi:hypothetical protein
MKKFKWSWLVIGGLVGLIIYLWNRTTNVNATVTIPQDEIVVTNKSHSIVSVTTDAAQGDSSSLEMSGFDFGVTPSS